MNDPNLRTVLMSQSALCWLPTESRVSVPTTMSRRLIPFLAEKVHKGYSIPSVTIHKSNTHRSSHFSTFIWQLLAAQSCLSCLKCDHSIFSCIQHLGKPDLVITCQLIARVCPHVLRHGSWVVE